jgi:hypothetical protein
MAFKSSPKKELSPEKVADIRKFAQQANEPVTLPPDEPEDEQLQDPEKPPWENLDPKAKNSVSASVWFNEHDKAMLNFLAVTERRSVQQTIKLLLLPALKKRAKKVHKAVVDGDEI